MPVGDVDRIGAETTDRVRDVDNKLDARTTFVRPRARISGSTSNPSDVEKACRAQMIA